MVKKYKSEVFRERIEASVANISAKPGDEFMLVGAYYEINEFNCELCGHKHCVHAFVVKNLNTEIEMKVGSECIHHFEDKGVDINLAEGLMKRVIKSVITARKSILIDLGKAEFEKLPEEEKNALPFYKRYALKEELGKAAFKKLSKEEKRVMVTNAHMIAQAKELLSSVKYRKHILTEEEIESIISLGLEKELEKII